MAQINIDVSSQFPALNQYLTTLEARLNGDLTPLMEAIGAVLENSTRQRFADKKSPDGVSWATLMPSTIRRKVNKKGQNAGILVESGDLMASLTYQASSHRLEVGTPESYGTHHQFGTTDIPARPFLGISEDDKQSVYDMINEYLQEQ